MRSASCHRKQAQDPIYIAIVGVMEYNTDPRLQDLYQAISSAKRLAIMALVKPVDPDHNLDIRQESYAYGSELGWSHPHTHYLKSTGYEIEF